MVKDFSVTVKQARVCVVPVNVDGSPLDFKKSILADVYEAMKTGDLDGIDTGLEGSLSMLVKSNGRWFEVAWRGGPTVCDQ